MELRQTKTAPQGATFMKVKSFQYTGTLESDRDVGAIRINGMRLSQLKNAGEPSARNVLVRVTKIQDGKRGPSIVRIARAATPSKTKVATDPDFRKALNSDEIAMQYDDRIILGIKDAGSTYELIVERHPFPVIGYWNYLWNHSSPLVRITFFMSLLSGALGALIGAILGIVTAPLTKILSTPFGSIFVSQALVAVIFVGIGIALGRWISFQEKSRR